MYLDQLDEAEGLTLKMVIDYAIERGWRTRPNGAGERLLLPDGTQSYAADDPLFLVARIAEHERTTAQELLRRVNPRMRPGVPDAESVRAHENGEGWWCARTPGGILRVGKFTPMLCFAIEALHGRQTVSPREVSAWSFWPCDAHGNKVRRGPR